MPGRKGLERGQGSPTLGSHTPLRHSNRSGCFVRRKAWACQGPGLQGDLYWLLMGTTSQVTRQPHKVVLRLDLEPSGLKLPR